MKRNAQQQVTLLSQRLHLEHKQYLNLVIVTLMALLACQLPSTCAMQHPVFKYLKGNDQRVTSSTLMWESHNRNSTGQLQYAVEGGKYVTKDEHYPIYVCRVNIEGVYTSGHTEKIMQDHVCVAAHDKHGKYEQFDVLVNKGHLGKIAWKHWRKYDAGLPTGVVSVGDDMYIARRKKLENGDKTGADYNLGRLDPTGLGNIKVFSHGKERSYDEGEILVETEPFRYELRDIKLDKIRADIRENLTDLASGILKNEGNEYSLVEMVMSYDFDYVQNWGSHEGTARGLPTKVYEKDASMPADIKWGLKYSEKRYETKSVHTKLWPGTALNVTLKGVYVTLDAPYSAKLYAFYNVSEDSVSRKISAEVLKSYLKEVKLEFSPVYWFENGTLVPTTTTTSTSTTSTTTTHATTTTGEPAPIHEPPVVQVKNIGSQHSGPDSLEKALQNNDLTSNSIPENISEDNRKGHFTTGSASLQVASVWTAITSLVSVYLAIVLNI